MSDYEDKCKYYENLYKPKQTTSGNAGSIQKMGVNNPVKPIINYSPDEPEEDDDYLDPWELIQSGEERNGDLDAIKVAVTSARDTFVADIDSYSSATSSLEESPITQAFIEFLGDNSFNITGITD